MSENKPTFDPTRFKEQERNGFNLVAERYEQGMEQARPVVERLLELAKLHKSGLKVLDIATGPGMVARRAATLVGESGAVVGVDIAEEAVYVARERANEDGLDNVTFETMDAENLLFADSSFDRVIISFGLMHFPDSAKALAEVWRVLRPGGIVAVAVWAEAEEVPTLQLALEAITRNFPPPKIERPSMFRFGGSGVLEKLLEDSGFSQTSSQKVQVSLTVADAREYWTRFLDVAGITTVALAKQPPEVMEKLISDTNLESYKVGDMYTINSKVVVAAGTK